MKCLAFVTPITVNDQSNRDRRAVAINVAQIMRKERPNLEDYFKSDSLKIAEEMLNAMWDRVKFSEMFDMNVEFVVDDNTIEYEIFVQSLAYIQVSGERCGFSTVD